jgi:hypothetical protein
MKIYEVLQSQYLAALAMLKHAIVKCPEDVWDDPQDKDAFWFKAYHALYYAHLYLQPTRGDFVRWKNHTKPESSAPLPKGEVLHYLRFVEEEVARRIPTTDLDGESGFHGFRMNKLELQFVNIRHIQQHAGELYERLGSRAGAKLQWAEKRHGPKK